MQRWCAEVGVALQTANAEAIQGSLGFGPGGGGLSGDHQPLSYTLLPPTGAGADYDPSEEPQPPEANGAGEPGAGFSAWFQRSRDPTVWYRPRPRVH